MQAPPAELYDEILRLTFTPSANLRLIGENYRPPSTLQVSQATRSQFANLYYGNKSTFIIPKHLATRYLSSLHHSHRSLICSIRIPGTTPQWATIWNVGPVIPQRGYAWYLLRGEGGFLEELIKGTLVAREVVKLNVVFSGGTSKWMSFSDLVEGL